MDTKTIGVTIDVPIEMTETRPQRGVIARNWRWLFLAMLITLHVAVMRGVGDTWARGLTVASFGLFILWQPFMRGEYRLSIAQLGGIATACALVLWALNWWLLLLWAAALAGLVGGKMFLFQERWLRRFYLIALTYLIMLVLVGIVPQLFPGEIQSSAYVWLARYGLPILIVPLALFPVEAPSSEEPGPNIDFFHGLLLFMVLIVLVLGSTAFMLLGRLNYFSALTATLLLIAGALLLLSWGWNPRARFSGLSMFFSRYLLTVGLPFEQWLHFLAATSQQEVHPDRFLDTAFAGMGKLPWVSGGSWKSNGREGGFGDPGGHRAQFDAAPLSIELHTEHPLTPALVWHFGLLARLLAEFYVAKQREQKLQKNSYVQAVHETGARLTHDIKNLLQSLNSLVAVVQNDSDDSPELHALVRRQLPVISQRLQNTLDKLRKPAQDTGQFIIASIWWRNLQKSYQGMDITFEAVQLVTDPPLPQSLFDSVADNLLQNALRKQKAEGNVKIKVTLIADQGVSLAVCDSGRPVDPEIARDLLSAPVGSQSGLGIGLYQAARQAETAGFELELTQNEHGKVCFTLAGTWRDTPH